MVETCPADEMIKTAEGDRTRKGGGTCPSPCCPGERLPASLALEHGRKAELRYEGIVVVWVKDGDGD